MWITLIEGASLEARPKKYRFYKRNIRENKIKQLHIISICSRNEKFTGGSINASCELLNAAEIQLSFLKLMYFGTTFNSSL